jgi:hypothetical protein
VLSKRPQKGTLLCLSCVTVGSAGWAPAAHGGGGKRVRGVGGCVRMNWETRTHGHVSICFGVLTGTREIRRDSRGHRSANYPKGLPGRGRDICGRLRNPWTHSTHADADELIASAPQVSFIVSTLVRQKLLGDGPRQALAAPGKAAKQKTG